VRSREYHMGTSSRLHGLFHGFLGYNVVLSYYSRSASVRSSRSSIDDAHLIVKILFFRSELLIAQGPLDPPVIRRDQAS